VIALNTVLVVTDFSEASTTALQYGRALVSRFGAALHVLHIAEKVSAQAEAEEASRTQLEALFTELEQRSPEARPIVVTSAPALDVVDYARHANVDLIVVGAPRRRRVRHFFIGDVAEHVARSAHCPVLVVKHPEHDFVVPDVHEVPQRA
jgi:nucleotide-binding universal stress UspA family protein